jgi:anaerobic magnesium-protoporphyrin IX monomethyl ester cyclase
MTSWMHDLPGETGEDSKETLSLARLLSKLPTNRQMHHFYTPFPSTEMYDTFFGSAYDEDKRQADWATSNTYAGSSLWRGRQDFRESVLAGLEEIRRQSPGTFERKPLPTP